GFRGKIDHEAGPKETPFHHQRQLPIFDVDSVLHVGVHLEDGGQVGHMKNDAEPPQRRVERVGGGQKGHVHWFYLVEAVDSKLVDVGATWNRNRTGYDTDRHNG